MTRRFRSKSCSLSSTPPPLYEGDAEEDDDGYFADFNTDDEDDDGSGFSENPASTPFLSPGGNGENQPQFSVLGVVAAALRKSLVTCSVDADDVASDVDIGWPTDVRHVSHVTFDRFDGFLGIPLELQPEIPPKPPSASASVFGVSAQSMQCSFDQRGNSIPTILLMMQSMLYEQGGLHAEGIFRINAENSQKESVRKQLNKGVMPHGIDVHCLSGLIKAWFRELPSGVLDCLKAEDVMHCNTEEECSELVKQLPPTEGALLDWAINLMADVVQHHQRNKMNARNIAMVFAPNMTQMADPLTALVHAVQVMNFVKTLIEKTLAERQEGEQSAAAAVFVDDDESRSCSNAVASTSTEVAATMTTTTTTTTRKRRTFGHGFKEEYVAEDGILHRLSLRRGMQKLYRHPVFHLTKTQPKKLYNSS